MNAHVKPWLQFETGALIVVPDGEFRYRERVQDGHLLLSLKTGVSEVRSNDVLERLYTEGALKVGPKRPRNRQDDFSGLAPGELLNARENARAWWLGAWDEAPCPLSHKKVRDFVADHAEEARRKGHDIMPASGTLLTWIRQRGEWGFRPSSSVRTRTGKVGRMSKWGDYVEYAIWSCVCWRNSSKTRSKHDGFVRLKRMLKFMNFWAERSDPANGKPFDLPDPETFRLRLDKADTADMFEARNGARRRRLNFGGTAPITAPRCMHTVMIDSTTTDGWCVFREETLVPLGRPTTYIATDVRSRNTLSDIWLGPPSLEGIMSIVKKVLIEWGRPVKFIVDNTWEHRSPSFDEAMRSAGIDLVWAPVNRPEYKDVVEVTFNTLNKAVFHKLEGGAVPYPPHMMRRLDLDPAKTASVTLEKLQDMTENFLKGPHLLREHGGIGEKPGVVWDREIVRPGAKRVVDDMESLLAHFGQVEVRKLTREGITLRDGLRFYDREAVERLLSDLNPTTPTGNGERTRRPHSLNASPIRADFRV